MDITTIKRTVDAEAQALVSRAIRKYLNSSPVKPCKIMMEYLSDDHGAAISATETPYKLKSYINGGYLAAYECDIIYRTIPENDDERVEADEKLDALALWARQNKDLLVIPGFVAKKIDITSISHLTARYNNDAEDHTTHLQIQFEVI